MNHWITGSWWVFGWVYNPRNCSCNKIKVLQFSESLTKPLTAQHVRTSTSACTRMLTTTHPQVKAENRHKNLWENAGKRSFMQKHRYVSYEARLTDLNESIRHRTQSQVTSRQRALVASSGKQKNKWLCPLPLRFSTVLRLENLCTVISVILCIRFLMHMDHFLKDLGNGLSAWTALRSTNQVRPRTQT